MNYPKVQTVKAINEHTLLVEFDNSDRKLYDAAPLFEREAFSLLRNYGFFKNVKVEKSGYAVFWNDDIDLSEYELWTNGKAVDN